MTRIRLDYVGDAVLEKRTHFVIEEGGVFCPEGSKTFEAPFHEGYEPMSYSFNCSELHGYPTHSVLYVNTEKVVVQVYKVPKTGQLIKPYFGKVYTKIM